MHTQAQGSGQGQCQVGVESAVADEKYAPCDRGAEVGRGGVTPKVLDVPRDDVTKTVCRLGLLKYKVIR